MFKEKLSVLFFVVCSSLNICYAQQDIVKNGSAKNVNIIADTPPPPCEFELNEAEANRMVMYYDMLFDQEGLTKQFWLSECLIKSLADFLVANPTYDGINFSLGAKRKFLGKLYSKLIIVATTEAPSPTERKKHNNEWAKLINLPPNCNFDENIFINEGKNDSEKWINKFGEDFRGETKIGERPTAKKAPLSISVWMKACKIKEINTILQNSSILDGLMAKTAAYYKSDAMFLNKEREYEIQSTLIFIPTINKLIDWKELAKFGIVKTKTTEVYNHGSLCPQQCD